MRRIACLLVLITGLVCLSSRSALSAVPTLIIQQVRGPEACCHPGTSDMLLKVSSDYQQMPIAWALRYDALTNDDFLNQIRELPQNQTVGILLEVIPELASASGVTYRGEVDGSDWNGGNRAFLIGYTQTERKKLIDQVFRVFYDAFHAYPTFTAAWMIDSWSLDYIRSTYGVRLHELTKEQYETDSYTLYGGIFNVPYYPSRTHPLIPARNERSGLDLVVVRQTVSDIENNYGSYHSFYTSQPNDYLANPQKKDFNYFTTLVDSVHSQEEKSQLMVLGLENSTEWGTYKDEYIKQLEYIREQSKSDRLKLYSPFDFYNAFHNQTSINEPRILKSSAFPDSGVLWYFGPQYRALLEVKNQELRLTDLRIWGDSPDPYRDTPAEFDRVYWVVPYLFDSSQQFSEKGVAPFLYQGNPVRRDDRVERFTMRMMNEKIKQVEWNNGELTLAGETHTVRLLSDRLETTDEINFGEPLSLSVSELISLNTKQYFTFARHPRFFLDPNQKEQRLVLGWEAPDLTNVPMATIQKVESSWIMTFLNLNSSDIARLSSIWQPDRSTLRYEPQASDFFWHNTEAIAGKSPVRLMVDPRNILGRPAPVRSVNITADPPQNLDIKLPPHYRETLSSFFMDLAASQSGTVEIGLSIDGNIISDKTSVRFFPDCSKDVASCLNHKDDLVGFGKVLLRDKTQELTEKARRYIEMGQQVVTTWANELKKKINLTH